MATAEGTVCPGVAPVRIAEGVFVRPGHSAVVFEASNVANVGFVVGDRCVAVIDSGGSLVEGRALRCAIEQITPLPVCYVITTHAHPDHMLGNLAFKQDGVSFVGHAKLTRALALLGQVYLQRASAVAGVTLGNEHIVPPDTAVSDTLALDLGGRSLQVQAHETAHTDHDLTVYDSASGTLWVSDLLFVEHIPVVSGSLLGWQRVLQRLSQIPAVRAVPGHGPPSVPWPAAMQDNARYLSVLLTETRAWLAQGRDLLSAQQEVGYGERPHWALFDEYHKRNVAAAFTELEWED